MSGEKIPKVMILCGGQGTRLREETEFRPKPMVEIGGMPILWHIMKIYSHHGFNDFILCTGYKGSVIKEYFLNYEAMMNDFVIRPGQQPIEFYGTLNHSEWTVTIADTGLETNTGGRVKRAQRYVDGPFLMTYGDTVADVDISSLIEFHLSHGKIGTVTTVRPPSRFGVMELDGDGTVLRFREKPQVDDWVNAGFFVFNEDFFEYLDPDCVLEADPLERLAKEGELMAYKHHGFWHPMDTYREFQALNSLWDRGEVPWKTWA